MYRIGIDLGGTNIAAGLVNENYEIVCKKSVPTNAKSRTGEEIVAAMAELMWDPETDMEDVIYRSAIRPDIEI